MLATSTWLAFPSATLWRDDRQRGKVRPVTSRVAREQVHATDDSVRSNLEIWRRRSAWTRPAFYRRGDVERYFPVFGRRPISSRIS